MERHLKSESWNWLDSADCAIDGCSDSIPNSLEIGTFEDYAELVRLGHVTRARMTQIMKLLYVAPDIQEQILFLAPAKGINERNLRKIVDTIEWEEQRKLV